jgi:virulence factor Mce-like protein
VSLARQIRRYGRELLALIVINLIGIVVTVSILAAQDFNWPWEDFYEVRAEFASGQAVTPGQGQAVLIAGVRVGEVGAVELEDGRAVVTVQIEEDQAPIYRDAHMALRPRTGLQDMQIILDPGSPRAGAVPEGGTLPLARTEPTVNFDEFLTTLDTDTRDWLRLTAAALGEGLDRRGNALRKLLVATQPTAAQLRSILRTLAGRRHEITRLVSNLNRIATAAASRDRDISRTISASADALGALARQDGAVRESLTRLPGTLASARSALSHAPPLARALEPAARQLRPALRALVPSLREIRPLLRDTKPILRDQLRPLVRKGLPVLRDLRPAAADLRVEAPQLQPIGESVNYIANELLHNPPGPEEGYLYWLSWFAHNGASMVSNQDAHGAGWRGLVLFSCSTFENLDSLLPDASLPLSLPDLSTIPGCSEEGAP